MLAGVLISNSLLDLLASVLPSAVLQPLWRSHATAQLGDGLPFILIGLFLALAVAVLLHDRRTQRVLAVACGALAVICVASLSIRALDHSEVILLLDPQQAFDFGETSFVVNAKYLTALLMLCALATIGSQASPRARRTLQDRQARVLGDLFPKRPQAGRPPNSEVTAAVEVANVEARVSEVAEVTEVAAVVEVVEVEALVSEVAEVANVEARASEVTEVAAVVEVEALVSEVAEVTDVAEVEALASEDPQAEIPTPPDDILRSEVLALVDTGTSLTGARREVGSRYGISLSTVRRRTK